VALVGKGIMFDTGGLSIKPTSGMCGMKHDMAGAAAVLAAFSAAVECKLAPKTRLHAVLCVAENAVGPLSYRNDDILAMYSGKTVEINNTDAEGRLVLADGVAHAVKNLFGRPPKKNEKLQSCGNSHGRNMLVVTMATLTGAQLMATGKTHAGVLSRHEKHERAVIAAAAKSGDLAFPLLYAPEILHNEQFASTVADMRNSVKDRSNAPSSAAGHFIESHLGAWYNSRKDEASYSRAGFVHIDIAGPSADAKSRATGYGVALLFEFLRNSERV
jgi:probable aminopeptidase NPEPL1